LSQGHKSTKIKIVGDVGIYKDKSTSFVSNNNQSERTATVDKYSKIGLEEEKKRREEERLRKEREDQERLRKQKEKEEQERRLMEEEAQRQRQEKESQRKAREVEEQGRKAREERESQRKLEAQKKDKDLQEQRAEEERQRRRNEEITRIQSEKEEERLRLENEKKSSGGGKWIFGVIIIFAVLALGWYGTQDSSSLAISTPTTSILKIEPENTNLDAKVVDVKIDHYDVRAGEKLTTELLIANTGIETITSETVEIKTKIKTLDDTLANMALKTMSEEQKTRNYFMDFNTEIKPGTNGKIAAVLNTIEQMQGRSLAGTYEMTITLSVNGQKVEARIMPLTLKSGTPRVFTPVPTP